MTLDQDENEIEDPVSNDKIKEETAVLYQVHHANQNRKPMKWISDGSLNTITQANGPGCPSTRGTIIFYIHFKDIPNNSKPYQNNQSLLAESKALEEWFQKTLKPSETLQCIQLCLTKIDQLTIQALEQCLGRLSSDNDSLEKYAFSGGEETIPAMVLFDYLKPHLKQLITYKNQLHPRKDRDTMSLLNNILKFFKQESKQNDSLISQMEKPLKPKIGCFHALFRFFSSDSSPKPSHEDIMNLIHDLRKILLLENLKPACTEEQQNLNRPVVN